jgi:glucan 1,3-beta-glucosidase
MRRIGVILGLLLMLVAANGYWFELGRPIALADAKLARIACVSYAPYHEPGETPFDAHLVVSAQRIDADLATLARRFNCVRTYSVSAGLDQVPALARKHGMTVYLGIWLSRNALDNERELSHGIEIANRERDVVRAVIVGNEVLLRGELAQETLATHIERVKAATGLPVTYADVWEFWLKYPKVAPAVSFITIHILPYWEDEPVPIDAAIDHVRAIREQMQAAFAGRELLIGETGWPSEGRQRRGAVPSRVNQARFAREFLNWAEPAGVQYNVIEAFDQPWKRLLEGTVGGYWGFYDSHLSEKFPMLGAVVEEPDWRAGPIAGLIAAALALVVALAFWRDAPPALLVFVMGANAAGATLWAQWRQMGFANRSVDEWLLTGSLTLVALATVALQLVVLTQWSAGRRVLSAPRCLSDVRWRAADSGDVLGALRFVWLFCVAVVNLLLVFDARYRDFPAWLFVAPIAGYVLCALAAAPSDRAARAPLAIEERLLSCWAIASALIIIVLERPINLCADAWGALCVVLGLCVLGRSGLRRTRLR